MDEDLSELQRRMLCRQQQHHAQCTTLNGLALVGATLLAAFVLVHVWEHTSSPEAAADANYVAARIGTD